jgi:protein-disulfide isomerase
MISLSAGPFRGNKDALVVLLDFSDYQCPFCGRFVRETMPQIDHDYLQTGKIKYVFRDLPLESIHPLAFKAAEAARCAGEQNRFWEMHDRLYQNQNALDVGSLPIHAQALGLNVNQFAQCLNSDKYLSSIRKDISDATNAGIQGTPNFVIALVDQNNPKALTIRVWRQIVGAQSYANYKAALDSAIAASK